MPVRSRLRGIADEEVHLPTGFVGRFEEDRFVPAFGGDARGFEACRPRADDHRAEAFLRLADHVRHRRLAPGGGIVDAKRLVAFVDAVEAIGGAHAGADARLFSGRDLPADMGIGHMRPRHPHHVELAGGDRVARRRHIRYFRGVEDGEFRFRPHLAREIEMRRVAHARDGDDVRERGVGIDMAADDVEEIDLARTREAARDLDAFLAREARFPILVGGKPKTQDEIRAHGFAHGIEHAPGEAETVLQAAAPFVGAPVGGGRPEAVDQVAVDFEFDPVEACLLHARRGGGVVARDAGEIPLLGLFREGAVGGFAHRGGGDDGQPIALVPIGAAAEMGDLDHHRRTRFVAIVGKAAEPGHDLVTIGVEVAEGGGAVGADDGRSGGHGQPDPSLGLFQVVETVAVFRHPLFGIGGLVRRRHQPVTDQKVLQAVGFEQRIGGHRGLLRRPC
jgi:hypothetical protein